MWWVLLNLFMEDARTHAHAHRIQAAGLFYLRVSWHFLLPLCSSHRATFLFGPAAADCRLITLPWLHLHRQLYHVSRKEARGDARSLLQPFSREIWCRARSTRPWHGLLLKYIACINQTAYHAQVLFHQNKEPISAIVRCLMRATEEESFILIVCYWRTRVSLAPGRIFICVK